MTLMFHKVASAASAVALTLTASPAFALGLNIDQDARANTSTKHATVNVNASISADLQAALRRCKTLSDDERDACEAKAFTGVKGSAEASESVMIAPGLWKSFRDDAKNNADASAETKINVFTRERTRLTLTLERAIKKFRSSAQRFCRATETDDSAVAACMKNIKLSISTSINAMIEAAFQ